MVLIWFAGPIFEGGGGYCLLPVAGRRNNRSSRFHCPAACVCILREASLSNSIEKTVVNQWAIGNRPI